MDSQDLLHFIACRIQLFDEFPGVVMPPGLQIEFHAGDLDGGFQVEPFIKDVEDVGLFPGDDPQQPDPTELKKIEDKVIKDIEEAVQPLLLKVAQGEDPYPRITVKAYAPTAAPAPDGPRATETAFSWLGSNWQTLGMFLLALVGVFVLRGMIRSAQIGTVKAEGPVAASARTDEEDEVRKQEEDPLLDCREGGLSLNRVPALSLSAV